MSAAIGNLSASISHKNPHVTRRSILSVWAIDASRNVSRRALSAEGAHPGALGVQERLGGDLSGYPTAEDVDVDLGPDPMLGGQVGVGDRAPDRVAVAPTGHAPADLLADADRLVAQSHR